MRQRQAARWLAAVFAGAMLCAVVAGPAWAQTRPAPAKAAASPASTATDPAMAAQAQAWTAFYDGKYEDAAKLCAELLKVKDERTRLQAAHCLARCQWASGQPAAKTLAAKGWTQLAKAATSPASTLRAEIGKVLTLDVEAKPENLAQAVAGMESVCKAKPAGTAMAEALIELGRLYVRAARWDDAQKTLEQVPENLKDPNLKRLELTAAEAAPFLAAAKKALGRLKYEREAGRELFEKAEALRLAKKYPEAIEAYKLIAVPYSQTDYGMRSQYLIGECLRDSGKPADAVALWRGFIKLAPAGPWRGQAAVDLIDLCLDYSLDFRTAKEQAVAAFEQMRPGLDGEKSAASWRLASKDLYLRIGAIAYLEGRYPGAAMAFKEAAGKGGKAGEPSKSAGAGGKSATANANNKDAPKPAPQGLDLLIALAEASQPVTPADIGSPVTADLGTLGTTSGATGDRAAMAMALSRIYYLAGSGTRERSQALLDKLLEPKTATALTAPQKAYAQFSQALLLEAALKPDDAKVSYLASIKTYPTGTWHDETLFRLASMVQREAEQKAQSAAAGTSGKGATASKTPAPLGKSAYAAARGQALPYWTELIKRYPQSPYIETAGYSVGLLYYEGQQWKNALAVLDDFTTKYPASLFKGEALWLLARCNFEQLLEPTEAKRYYGSLDTWLKTAREAKPAYPAGWETAGLTRHEEQRDSAAKPAAGSTGQNGEETKRVVLSGAIPDKREPGEKPQSYISPRYFDELESETAKSLGFIAFVDNRKDDAAKYYDRTEKLDEKLGWVNSKNPQFSDCSRLKWGLQHGYLYAYPQELAQYQDRQRFAVLLGDFYYVTQQFGRAGELARRMLDGDFGRLDESTRVYPLYLKATCTYWGQDSDAAFKQYMEVVKAAKSVGVENLQFTAERAAYAAGSIARQSADPTNRATARELLRQLAFSKRDDEFAYKARISYALLLTDEGRQEEGVALLKSFPESAGEYKKIADAYLKILANAAKNQSGVTDSHSQGGKQ